MPKSILTEPSDKALSMVYHRPDGHEYGETNSNSNVKKGSEAVHELHKAIPITSSQFYEYAYTIGLAEVANNDRYMTELSKKLFLTKILQTEGDIIDLAAGYSKFANEINTKLISQNINPKAFMLDRIYTQEELKQDPYKIQASIFKTKLKDQSAGMLICKGACEYMLEELYLKDKAEINIAEILPQLRSIIKQSHQKNREGDSDSYKKLNEQANILRTKYSKYFDELKLDMDMFTDFINEAYRIMRPGAELRISDFPLSMLISPQESSNELVKSKMDDSRRIKKLQDIFSKFKKATIITPRQTLGRINNLDNSSQKSWLQEITIAHNLEGINASLLVLQKS